MLNGVMKIIIFFHFICPSTAEIKLTALACEALKKPTFPLAPRWLNTKKNPKIGQTTYGSSNWA